MATNNLAKGQPAGDRGREIGASLGGKAVKGKTPPATCPTCGQPMAGRSWHSYIGHRGLHRTADRHFAGDAVAALRHALRHQDPNPENGAWRQWITNAEFVARETGIPVEALRWEGKWSGDSKGHKARLFFCGPFSYEVVGFGNDRRVIRDY